MDVMGFLHVLAVLGSLSFTMQTGVDLVPQHSETSL